MGQCDVCGKKTEQIHVRASALGPVSFGYCKKCLEIGAEPYSSLKTILEITKSWENVAPWAKEVILDSLEYYNISLNDFLEDVNKE